MTANLVAVTACPTGIAHSQMGAEGLERAAADAGHDIRVEVQGALGVENSLTDEDLDWADAVIVAADVRVDVDRFHSAGLPVVEVPVGDAVTDPEGVVARAVDAAAVAEGDGGADGDTDTDSRAAATDGRGTGEGTRLDRVLDSIRELL